MVTNEAFMVVRLVTTWIVDENTAAERRHQKFPAVREFRQHGIILQAVWSTVPHCDSAVLQRQHFPASPDLQTEC